MITSSPAAISGELFLPLFGRMAVSRARLLRLLPTRGPARDRPPDRVEGRAGVFVKSELRGRQCRL